MHRNRELPDWVFHPLTIVIGLFVIVTIPVSCYEDQQKEARRKEEQARREQEYKEKCKYERIPVGTLLVNARTRKRYVVVQEVVEHIYGIRRHDLVNYMIIQEVDDRAKGFRIRLYGDYYASMPDRGHVGPEPHHERFERLDGVDPKNYVRP